MKKIIITISILIIAIVSTRIAYSSILRLGASPSVFQSSQVGSTPVNGYYLKTDGTNSTWAVVTGGGGGGSAGGTWSTTTSSVSGQLNNYSNNTTDIVNIGGSSTTTSPWWFDPNKLVQYINGKIGIGTTSPYLALSVQGASVLGNSATAGYFIATTTTASIFPYASTTGMTSTGSSYFATIGGTVGIGTTTPWATLSVNAPAAIPSILVGSTTGTSFMVDEAGRVGIKVTPLRHSSFGNADLSVNGKTYIGGNLTMGQLAAINNLSSAAAMTFGSGGTGTGNIDFTTSLGRVQNFTFNANIGASGGNLGISTSSPYAKLSVAGNSVSSTTVGIAHTSNGTGDALRVSTSTNSATSTVFVIDGQGDTGIGTSSPWKPLSVQGGVAMQGLTSSTAGNALCILSNFEVVNSGGTNCTTSSLRFKTNIVDLQNGLTTIMQLRPREFTRKQASPSQPSGKEIGFIAEEVQKVEPRLVEYEADGKTPRGVNYLETTAILTKAIQEQQKQIEELRKEIQLLKIKK